MQIYNIHRQCGTGSATKFCLSIRYQFGHREKINVIFSLNIIFGIFFPNLDNLDNPFIVLQMVSIITFFILINIQIHINKQINKQIKIHMYQCQYLNLLQLFFFQVRIIKQILNNFNKNKTKDLYLSRLKPTKFNLLKIVTLLLTYIITDGSKMSKKQQILHQQSYIYPCQLSSLQSNSKQSLEFMFYSPMNAYASFYDSEMKQQDFLDLEGNKYEGIHNFQFSQQERIAIFTSDTQIKLVESSNQEQSFSLNIQFNGKLVSNVITLSTNYQQQNKYALPQNNPFNISYLSAKSIRNPSDSPFSLHICQFIQNEQQNKQILQHFNPEQHYQNIKETDQREECNRNREANQSNTNIKNIRDRKVKRTSIQLQLINPDLDQQGRMNSLSTKIFQLLQSPFQPSNIVTLFDKKLSTIYDIDLNQDGCVSDKIISDYDDSTNSRNSLYQTNKLEFLSERTLINYSSNGVIRIIDKRTGRIVSIRDLNAEVNQDGLNGPHTFQQNYVKFYNNQKEQITARPNKSTHNFLINYKNEVRQIDLRSNRLNQKLHFFKFDQPQSIGNYEVKMDKLLNQRTMAFTAQSRCSFKGIVLKQKYA